MTAMQGPCFEFRVYVGFNLHPSWNNGKEHCCYRPCLEATDGTLSDMEPCNPRALEELRLKWYAENAPEELGDATLILGTLGPAETDDSATLVIDGVVARPQAAAKANAARWARRFEGMTSEEKMDAFNDEMGTKSEPGMVLPVDADALIGLWRVEVSVQAPALPPPTNRRS